MRCKDPQFEFNKQIIDATNKYCVAYKSNLAFYEVRGPKGLESLERTNNYLRENYPEVFRIADGKRGDIGNTSIQYARAYFDTMPFNAITVPPYMGGDSITPFLFQDRWVILLALTSNPGSFDFQHIKNADTGNELFEDVIIKSKEWGTPDNMMYVVGATQAKSLVGIRKLIPNNFILVPGVGAQGGSLDEVAEYGMNKDCGLLVNSSRDIILSSPNEDFAEVAAKVAKEKYQQPMEVILHQKGLI